MDESVLLTALHKRTWWTDTSHINSQTRRRGWTALMIAAELGDLKLVEHLLDAGADPRLIDSRGWTSLMWAVARDRAAVCECFLAYNLPTQAEISAAFSIAIKLRSARCLLVFLDRTQHQVVTMASLAIRVQNANALRELAKAGRINLSSKEASSAKSLRRLARQSGPSMYQALLDGTECYRFRLSGFAVSVKEGERIKSGRAKVTTSSLEIRIKSRLGALSRLLIYKQSSDYSLPWTNEVRFDVRDQQVQIVFPNSVVSITEPKVWLPLEVCRTAAFKYCGAMPFQERLEALIKSDLLPDQVFLSQCASLIADLGTVRDQMTVRQQEVNRRCALAASMGREPDPAAPDNWRRLQTQIDICEHYLRTAKELRLRTRGELRARSRTTPASTAEETHCPTTLDHDDDDEHYEKTCVVCWTNRKSYLTMPCRHLCLCAICHAATRWKRCPVCNESITDILRIFL